MNDTRQQRWSRSVRGLSGKPGGRAALLGMMALALFMTGAGPCSGPTSPVTISESTPGSPFKSQTESAVVFAQAFGPPTTIVAFNDNTDANGTYTVDPDGLNNQKWFPGFTLAGWAYSPDRANWSGGAVAAEFNDGTHNWVALFGDPALASGGSLGNFVYYSNLAATDAAFNQPGQVGYITRFDRDFGFPSDTHEQAVINGACVARSNDAGQSFAPWGCIYAPDHLITSAKTSASKSLDGGSLATDRAGQVYASYASVFGSGTTNSTPGRAFVFQADGNQAVGTFNDISPPFSSNIIHTEGHPLIRAKNGRVYLMQAEEGAGSIPVRLVLQERMPNGNWSQQFALTNEHQTGAQHQVNLGVNTAGAPTTIRQDPWFSFDVSGGQVRYAYTVFSSGSVHIHVGVCTLLPDVGPGTPDVGLCSSVPGWATETYAFDPSLNQFQPQVVLGKAPNGVTEVWKFVYLAQSAPGTALIDLMDSELNLAVPTVLSNFRVATPSRQACPDLQGYWGDYEGTAASPDHGFFTAFPRNGTFGVQCFGRTLNSTNPPAHIAGIDL